MFNHFQMFDDLYDVIFEITEGDNVRKQQMQAPRIIIEQENSITFMNNVYTAQRGET